jgi:hypothetical protein
MTAGFISERWPASNRNRWPDCVGIRSWSAYFGYGSLAKAYRDVDHYVVDHVRAFHVRRNKMQNRGTESFSRSSIYGELKVVALWKHHPNPTPIALP